MGMTNMLTVNVEYTDTFGGEANYCWVKRATFQIADHASRHAIMRQAKRLIGLTGLRGKAHDFGDMIEFRPSNSCTVMFVTYGEV
ncbi:hypothetical protein UFOVP95_47 [uncultured Caudovirales phage]|uniref:Uncharacterized protein n=1 Tax=uncultured Caudovirales phage TaxID=2100421 RepID=A0A6J5L337_9CAUD|nr:hypothetical protein UFOVP95_47 [uncultured Caudovirales phage]